MKRYVFLLLVLAVATGAAAQVRKVELAGIRKMPADSVRLRMVPVMRPAGEMTKVERTRLANEHYTFATVLDGDTVPLYHLREVTVYLSGMLLTPKEIKSNAKLIRNVRLMLPYAREAKTRLDVLETEIANLPKKERKAAIKRAEKEITEKYKADLSKYSFSQGLVLIKLIDRETNRTAYTLVGELKGAFRAGVYQAFAKLFGYNLKTHFDPQHDKKDDLIDRIVRSIERGQL